MDNYLPVATNSSSSIVTMFPSLSVNANIQKPHQSSVLSRPSDWSSFLIILTSKLMMKIFSFYLGHVWSGSQQDVKNEIETSAAGGMDAKI